MREALRSLTTRGRAFLAGGTTAALCGFVLDQAALVQIGVLVAALPLLSAVLLGRAKYRLSLARTLTPSVVAAGHTARVDLTLLNEGRVPTGILLLEDRLPLALGPRPRFVLEGIGHGWQRRASYRVCSDTRGRFEIGPMSVRIGDPFGMVALNRTFSDSAPLVVTPPTVPLTALPLSGAWTGSGDNRPRAFATGSAEDVTVREYRHGDDLRRVHWPSSARAGEMMVRREEQPWQARATVFLDNRVAAHRGQGSHSSLEAAVAHAASVVLHLTQRGFTVRLVTAAGDDASNAWHFRDTAVNVAPLMESLAVVDADPRARLETGWLAEGERGGLVIAVLGALGTEDRPFLSRLSHLSSSALALVLDVDQWSMRTSRQPASVPAPQDEVTALPRSLGWRAATVQPGAPLDRLWRQLGNGRTAEAGR